MVKLGIEDETQLCHYHFSTPRHSLFFFTFWTVFIVIIVIITEFNPYSGAEIPWDNCDMNKTWEPPMRPFINKLQFLSEQNKIVKFREKNQFYRRNNYTRIEYGTTLLSYCKAENEIICDWMAKKAQVKVPDEFIIKSITRTIELDPYFSSGLRFLVLQCISFRIIMSLIRTCDVLTSRRRHFSRFVQVLLSTSIFFSFLQSLSCFWITVLHSELDYDYIYFLHPFVYFFFGVATFFEMFIDLLHDSLDGRFSLIRTPRFYIKSTCFIAFSACYPQVVLNWFNFFQNKKCHAYVSLVDGLFEYICVICAVSYHFINSQMHVEMYITPTVEEFQNVSSFPKEIYSPFYQNDKKFVIYESLSEKK